MIKTAYAVFRSIYTYKNEVLEMLKTRMGTTIEFIKLDKWVVSMVVSIPHTKGLKVVASPTFTIDDLRQELALLEQAEPQPED